MATATAASLNVAVTALEGLRLERIVVVEHDPSLRKVLQRLFSLEGYEIELLSAPAGVFDLLRAKPAAALILDLPAPTSAVYDLCREITRAKPNIPIVILSSNSDVAEKVLMLEMGADDYILTPFSPRELLARIRALIRRASHARPAECFVFGDVLVDFSRTEVSRNGAPVYLTAKEHKTLEFLIKNAERVVPRDELLNQVWGYENYPCTRTVDNHILRLRQKLETEPSDPKHLLTVHSQGYKFVP